MIEQTATLLQVHDGDTITVSLNGSEERVRILGIQAMEIHPFEDNISNDYYADEATAKLSQLLGSVGSKITLKSEYSNTEILDRPAKHVYIGETNVAKTLLEEGYVLPFPHETENIYNELYLRLAQEAKDKKIGLWEKSDNFKIIVNYDAEGDDKTNLNGEWIKITNETGITQDISNWILRDSGLNFFVFPNNTSIKNNETITVYGGKGSNTGNTFYWENTDSFLDNFGEGVFLHENLNGLVSSNDTYPVGEVLGASIFPYTNTLPDKFEGKVSVTANYDAQGDDNVNLNGEWIEVKNISSKTIDLEGYQLHSEPLGSDHYYFDESTPLKAGETLKLHVGSGTDSALTKYWHKDTGILANSSDRVWLDTIDGKLVDEYTWPSISSSSSLSQEDVAKLYVTVFNRAGEKSGNDYWQKTGLSQIETIEKMLETTDSKEYFGSSLDTDQAFIEHIYQNTLNKTYSDDPSGIEYWVKQLEKSSRAEVVSKLIDAIDSYAPNQNNYNPNDLSTVEAYSQFNNRVEVSLYAAENLPDTPANYSKTLGFSEDIIVTGQPSTASLAKIYIEENLL